MALRNSLLVVLLMAIVAMRSSPSMVAGQPERPLFTITFNMASGSDIANYMTFIRQIRQAVANPGNYTRNIPMLRPQTPGSGPPFYIVLHNRLYNGTNISITMRMRPDNIYFDGFRVGDNTQWWEFRPSEGSVHLIPGSNFLPFEAGYYDLGDLAGTTVGGEALRDAVTTLTRWDGTDTGRRTNVTKEACIRLIVMISEAARFHQIANFVYDMIHNNPMISAPVGATNSDLINDWGLISEELIQSDVTARFSALPQYGINFPAQASAVLALLVVRNPNRHSSRLLSVDATGVASPGRQLLEIYSVQVLNIDGENPGDLYGTILVKDDVATPVYIYNRKRSNTESIKPNEYATLIGPSRALSALDSFTIDVSLMDYDSTSSDDEVSKGKIGWNYYDASNVYDQPKSRIVKGQYGSVAINYAVFSNAVAAIVQITLINGDGENPANVYGTLKSSTSLVPYYINLFNKISKEYVDVKPGAVIPLTRSVVVVPLGSSLKIIADLWDYDTSSSDDEIAQGTAVFSAQNTGDVTSSIKGKYGEISVKISWSSNWS